MLHRSTYSNYTWWPLALIFCVCTSSAWGVTRTASSGAWETNTTWSPVGAPSGGDLLIIPAGVTLTVNSNLNSFSSAIRIKVYGTLRFVGGGAKLDLPCGSIIELMTTSSRVTGNSSGNSQTIKICGTTYWSVGTNGDTYGVRTWPTNATLPVELISFEAERTLGGVELTWRTGSERGSSHFELYRRGPDGVETLISVLPAAGVSNSVVSYSATDMPEVEGVHYYRLLQFDVDATFTDLGTVAIWFAKKVAPTNWPNPATSEVNIGGTRSGERVSIVSLTGQVVTTTSSAEGYTRIPLEGVAPGSYLAIDDAGRSYGRLEVVR